MSSKLSEVDEYSHYVYFKDESSDVISPLTDTNLRQKAQLSKGNIFNKKSTYASTNSSWTDVLEAQSIYHGTIVHPNDIPSLSNKPSAYQKYLLWIQNKNIISDIEQLMNEANSITSLRAFVSIYSSIFLWVGAWGLLDSLFATIPVTHLKNTTIDLSKYYIHSPMFLVCGTLLMLYIGTLYENAGYGGSWRRPIYYNSHLKTKVTLAHFGQFLFYYGAFSAIYQIQDTFHIFSEKDIVYDAVTYCIGFIILCSTNSFWCLSGVTPPWYQAKHIEADDLWRKHFHFILLSVLVIFGFSIGKICTTDFLENYTDGNIWRELFYICAGLLLFVSTGSFVANSLIWTDLGVDNKGMPTLTTALTCNAEECDNEKVVEKKSSIQLQMADVDYNAPKSTKGWKWYIFIIFYIRAWISFEAQILHTTGSWTLFDEYLFVSTWYRNIVYVILGACGLHWSKALFMKACITPFSVPAQPDGLMRAMSLRNPIASDDTIYARKRRVYRAKTGPII